MNIIEVLADKSTKPLEKRNAIADAIFNGIIKIQDLAALGIENKKLALVFEAIEELSSKHTDMTDLHWLRFAEKHLQSQDNNIKRETARIVGNIAHLFPNDLETIIPKLIENTNNESTVIRWSCAYALGRIVALPKYAKSKLYDQIIILAEKEQMNGNKNQYINGLKKANKLRNL